MTEPVTGSHKEIHDIDVLFEVVTATLDKAGIAVEGLFLNADADFNTKGFRQACDKRG